MKLLAVCFLMEDRNYRVSRKILCICKVASLSLVVMLRPWRQLYLLKEVLDPDILLLFVFNLTINVPNPSSPTRAWGLFSL
jgi:hypothetical protein